MSAGSRAGPRVLIIAELCNPSWSSVPLVGWNICAALRAKVQAHIVTHVRNRADLEAAGLVEGQDFTAFDTSRSERAVSSVLARLGSSAKDFKGLTTQMAAFAFTYQYFERLVWKRFRHQIERGDFDIVHRITPLSPTVPSPIAARCRRAGVPFVIGPLNGGLPWPREFPNLRVREREWLSYVREAYKLVPGYRATRRNAAAIIVASEATASQLAEPYRAKSVYIPENGVDLGRFAAETRPAIALPLKVVFIGRLVPYKGADMLIDAIAPLAKAGKATLTLYGDGFEGPALRQRAEELGIAPYVEFAGWVSQAELSARVAQSHVFAFPSVREFGGAVVLEAMALGVVPIVVRYGGPGEHVVASNGFAVPLQQRDAIVADFRRILTQLAENPSLIGPMGRAARARVATHFTWEAKAGQIVAVYRWVLGETPKPDFGMPFADTAADDRHDTSSAGDAGDIKDRSAKSANPVEVGE